VRDVPLVAEHELVLLPTASVLREIRRQASERGYPSKTIAVVADPVLDERDPRVRRRPAYAAPAATKWRPRIVAASLGSREPREPREPRWAALPYAREEAQEILDLVPAGDRLGAFDFAASRDLVVGSTLEPYRFVHFATHARIDTEEPALSGIVLSMLDERGRPRDGFLSLFDLYHLRLPADLVVLSSCRTALGKELRGEGLVGLARGFMFAGSPRVVVSLWDVQDRATAELMKRFYVLLLHEGKPPVAALREAQLEMSRSEQWSEPYYWAGFVLQGDWR
jgi:CHAT domain-containing protein